jgi:very-short-patch-repair endonuclease
MICKICNKSFKNLLALSIHLSQHNYKLLDYYVDYENFKIPKCKYCNNDAKILNGIKFYKTCCSKECLLKSRKENIISDFTKEKISKSMKKAHKEGRANNWQDSKKVHNPSYPESFFKNIIENEFDDKNYISEYRVGQYSIDFAWLNKKLAIEIDGKQHEYSENKNRDFQKDKLLKENGWKILRIKWIDLFNNTSDWINIANDFINNSINFINYYDLIFESYQNEIDCEMLMKLLNIQFKIDKLGRKHLIDINELNTYKKLICESDIDFSKFGWVNKVSKILNISPQKVNKWMKRNMLDFYNEKCFKRNKVI